MSLERRKYTIRIIIFPSFVSSFSYLKCLFLYFLYVSLYRPLSHCTSPSMSVLLWISLSLLSISLYISVSFCTSPSISVLLFVSFCTYLSLFVLSLSLFVLLCLFLTPLSLLMYFSVSLCTSQSLSVLLCLSLYFYVYGGMPLFPNEPVIFLCLTCLYLFVSFFHIFHIHFVKKPNYVKLKPFFTYFHSMFERGQNFALSPPELRIRA